jgi:putative Mg2+ transporter-C (MgtC) family protein
MLDLGATGFDWYRAAANFGHIAAAYLLALPMAWDRERTSRSAGLRTFPLVAVASCGFGILGVQLANGSAESLSRVIQGLITGIGFIGGGAILKHDGTARGTATAASLWTTGAIGAAVALGRYEIAVVLSVVNYLTLRLLTPLKDSLHTEMSGEAGGVDDDGASRGGGAGS